MRRLWTTTATDGRYGPKSRAVHIAPAKSVADDN